MMDYFLILMSSSFRMNFFLNASDIREEEFSSLSEVHPRLYLNKVHKNPITLFTIFLNNNKQQQVLICYDNTSKLLSVLLYQM